MKAIPPYLASIVCLGKWGVVRGSAAVIPHHAAHMTMQQYGKPLRQMSCRIRRTFLRYIRFHRNRTNHLPYIAYRNKGTADLDLNKSPSPLLRSNALRLPCAIVKQFQQDRRWT